MILKRFSIFTFVVSLALSAAAQTGREWQDPNVNAVNREPVHTFFPDYAPSQIVEVLPGGDRIETSSEWVKSLNGLWKFNWASAIWTNVRRHFSPKILTMRVGWIFRFPQYGS